MDAEFTKSEKRRVGELATLAWDRQLRAELTKIGDEIDGMTEHQSSPHSVNDLIHDFHNGISRELLTRFNTNKPWIGVCRACYDGVLTDDDIAGDSERIRNGIIQFANDLEVINAIQH